jgi:hypothetical protein
MCASFLWRGFIRSGDFWDSNLLYHTFVVLSGHLSARHDINLVCQIYPNANHVYNSGYNLRVIIATLSASESSH